MVNLNYARVNSAQQQTLLHELNLIKRAGEENLSYQELIDDLVAMCDQAKQFILDKDAQHQHFTYVSEFTANIRQALQSQSSWWQVKPITQYIGSFDTAIVSFYSQKIFTQS